MTAATFFGLKPDADARHVENPCFNDRRLLLLNVYDGVSAAQSRLLLKYGQRFNQRGSHEACFL